jgi:hypothetical protein
MRTIANAAVICGSCEWSGEVSRRTNVCPNCRRQGTLSPPLFPLEPYTTHQSVLSQRA